MRRVQGALAPRGHNGGFQKVSGQLKVAVILTCVVVLTGCMEALQTTQAPAPPAALPTVPAIVEPSPVAGVAPTTPGSFAPDPATAAPTTAPMPAAPVAPTSLPPAPSLPPLNIPTVQPRTYEELWREQQVERTVFEAPRAYETSGAEIWWYDPVNGQGVALGTITGTFLAQAQFTLRGQNLPALEVPYQINQSLGLTAVSPAILQRIQAAGYTEWIETYVLITPNVIPR